MTKEKIIEDICNNKYYNNYCHKITNYNKLSGDLYQHVILQFIMMPEEKVIHLYGQNLKGYLCRMFWLNWHSKLAPFWREYKYDFDDISIDVADNNVNEEQEIIIHIANEVLKEEEEKCSKRGQYHWNVELFNLYVEDGNYRELARKLDIPYPTVRYNINEIKTKINERIANNTKRA